jgi:hypothetical protein
MGLLSRLFKGRDRAAASGDPEGLHIYVRCDRCGEVIHVRANKRTDITQEYQDDSDRATPVLHKEILGSKCQNLMYVHLTLDSSYNIVASDLERCTLVSQEAYEAQTH